ncbi:MAG: Clp protease ClpP [Beijerinckiaceae bacterium]|nr:Clp protease ClpP [Beijerinckiaceae bacterium]
MPHRLLINSELVLMGDVGDIWGDGSGFAPKDVLEALAEHGDGDLAVRLNSGGGRAWDGVAIYNALRAHRGEVTMHVDAIAASAASVIALAGSKRIMRHGAMLMIHDPSAVVVGTADDHRKASETLDKLADVVAGIYAFHTGAKPEEMRELMLAETWMDADEAVDRKFATEAEDLDAEAFSRFDYRLYAHAPDALMSFQRPQPRAPRAASNVAAGVDHVSAAHARMRLANETRRRQPLVS